jgi:hypothetical protein
MRGFIRPRGDGWELRVYLGQDVISGKKRGTPLLGALVQTNSDRMVTATTSRPRSSKRPSTLPNRPTPLGLETNSPSLHQTQGGSTLEVHSEHNRAASDCR